MIAADRNVLLCIDYHHPDIESLKAHFCGKVTQNITDIEVE